MQTKWRYFKQNIGFCAVMVYYFSIVITSEILLILFPLKLVIKKTTINNTIYGDCHQIENHLFTNILRTA